MPNIHHALLMPGFDGTGELFSPLLKVLDKSISTVTVRYSHEITFDDYVKSAAKLLPQEKAVLIAESFSGPIALALMAQYPSQIKSTILCATFATSPFRLLTNFVKFAPTVFFEPNPTQPHTIQNFCLNQETDDALLEQTLATIRSVKAKTIQARLNVLSQIDMHSILPKIKNPILYLQALRDNIVNSDLSEQLINALPNVTLKKIDGPHLLLQSRPTECAEAIKAFLNKR